jgi:asparagine synthase (glutamine-hydrolysing)
VGQSFLFASEIKALLACPDVPRKPNDDVLAWYLLKQPAADTKGNTFFDGVFSVQPGRLVMAKPEGVTTRWHWDFDRGERIRMGSFSEYAEAFRSLFERAVRRRLRSAYPVGISVSGGLDSSSIFCTALRMKQQGVSGLPELAAISYVFEEERSYDDKFFLSEIEREYGVSVERFPTRTELPESISQPVQDIEIPLIDSLTNCARELCRRVRVHGARSLVTGHWGDQMLFDTGYLVPMFRRLQWREIHRHLHAYADWYPDVGYKHYRRQFARDVLRSCIPDALLPVLRKYKHRYAKSSPRLRFYTPRFRDCSGWATFDQVEEEGFSSPYARSMYYNVRSGYYVQCLEVDNKRHATAGLELLLPFLDRDLVRFLMAIPGEMQSWEGVPKGILRQALKGVLPATIGTRRGKADFTDYANAAMNSARTPLVGLFEPTGVSVERGYVRTGIAEMVREIRTPGPKDDGLFNFDLSDLFGLEVWLRLFFENESPERKLPTWV